MFSSIYLIFQQNNRAQTSVLIFLMSRHCYFFEKLKIVEKKLNCSYGKVSYTLNFADQRRNLKHFYLSKRTIHSSLILKLLVYFTNKVVIILFVYFVYIFDPFPLSVSGYQACSVL